MKTKLILLPAIVVMAIFTDHKIQARPSSSAVDTVAALTASLKTELSLPGVWHGVCADTNTRSGFQVSSNVFSMASGKYYGSILMERQWATNVPVFGDFNWQYCVSDDTPDGGSPCSPAFVLNTNELGFYPTTSSDEEMTMPICGVNTNESVILWECPRSLLARWLDIQVIPAGSTINSFDMSTTNYDNCFFQLSQDGANDPDLLWYRMLNNVNGDGETNNPITLIDSSIMGNDTGTLEIPYQFNWHTNQTGAFLGWHFNGDPANGTILEVADSSRFNFTNQDFTINWWANPYTGGPFIMGNGSYEEYGWYISSPSSKIEIDFESPGQDYEVSTAGSVMAINVWQMYTVVASGTNVLMYVNAQTVPTVVAGTGAFSRPASSPAPFTIGRDPALYDDAGACYDGDMWGFRIYGHALCQTNIQAIYDCETNMPR